MAKKGASAGNGSEKGLEKARAARAAKGKRDLAQDVWRVQATLVLPVDGDVTVNTLKKEIEAAGGSLAVKSRRVVPGYVPSDNDDAGEIEDTGDVENTQPQG